MERFLYRLSRSEHAERFVLKGARMFQFRRGPLSRATKDIDLLGRDSVSVYLPKGRIQKDVPDLHEVAAHIESFAMPVDRGVGGAKCHLAGRSVSRRPINLTWSTSIARAIAP